MGAVDRWLWALQGLYRPAGGLGADWGPYRNSMGWGAVVGVWDGDWGPYRGSVGLNGFCGGLWGRLGAMGGGLIGAVGRWLGTL